MRRVTPTVAQSDMASNGSSPEYAALQQRVTGVESAVESIRKDIHSLVSKFDERSKMPWGTVLAGATLFWMVITSFVTIGGGVVAWGLLSQNQNMVKALDEFKAGYTADQILRRQDVSAEFARIDAALARSVPREEHQQIWLAQSNTDRDQQRQIDEIKAQIAEFYGVRDFFKDLQDRLDRLEQERLSRTRSPTRY